MRLLMRTSSDNEYDNADFAIVDLTESMAKQISARRKMLNEAEKVDPAISCLHFNSFEVTFYKDLGEEEQPQAFYDLREALESGSEDFAEIPTGMDLSFLDEEREEAECSKMAASDSLLIFPNVFCWKYYAANAGVETILMSYYILSKFI